MGRDGPVPLTAAERLGLPWGEVVGYLVPMRPAPSLALVAAAAALSGCGRPAPGPGEPPRLLLDVPDGQQGAPYRASIVVEPTPDAIPIVSAIDGLIPPGLELVVEDVRSIAVTGTPQIPGDYVAELSVRTLREGRIFDAAVELAIGVAPAAPGAPVQLVTRSLPDAVLDQAYAATLEATGGRPPYRFELRSPLPPGLQLSDDGTVSGTPTQPGFRSARIRVSADDGSVDEREVDIDVVVPEEVRPRVIPPLDLTPARIERNYRETLRGSGGDGGPYTWTLAVGRFPPGLDLRIRSGVVVELVGLPTQVGRRTFTLELLDRRGIAGQSNLSLSVVGPLGASRSGSLPTGRAGQSYEAVIDLVDAVPPVEVRVAGGAFPNGVSLTSFDEERVRIGGTTRDPGAFRFELEIEDRYDTLRRSYRVRVIP